MYVGGFGGDFLQSQIDMATSIDQLYASGVTNLVIDVTNNGGLYGFMMNAKQSDIKGCRWVPLLGTVPLSVPYWCDV